MINLLIFGFGLAVVVIVGSALAILISANNNTLAADAAMPVVGKMAAGKGSNSSKPGI